MKKQFRVKKSKDIEKIIKARRSVGNKYFVIYKKDNNSSNFKCAISVSKKYGNAVNRNHAKRHVREILKLLNYKSFIALNCLIVIKPSSIDLNYEDKYKSIKKLLLKLNILED